jgi:hypothetical protein
MTDFFMEEENLEAVVTLYLFSFINDFPKQKTAFCIKNKNDGIFIH